MNASIRFPPNGSGSGGGSFFGTQTREGHDSVGLLGFYTSAPLISVLSSLAGDVDVQWLNLSSSSYNPFAYNGKIRSPNKLFYVFNLSPSNPPARFSAFGWSTVTLFREDGYLEVFGLTWSPATSYQFVACFTPFEIQGQAGSPLPRTHTQVYYMRAYRKRATGMLVYVDRATIQGLTSLREAVSLNSPMRRVAFDHLEAWPLDLEKLLPRSIPLPDNFAGTQRTRIHCDAHPPTWATPEELRAWKLRFFIPDAAVLPRRTNLAYEPNSPVEADLNERLSLQVPPKFATEHDWDHWRDSTIAALQKQEAGARRLSDKGGSSRGISETELKKLEKTARIAIPKAGAREPEARTVDALAAESIESSAPRTTTPCDEPESLSCLLDIVSRNMTSWGKAAKS